MADDLTTSLIKQRESYRSNAYWDVNAWRVGYGSDTVTDPDGTTHPVTQSTVTTRAAADRDLARRIPQTQSSGVIPFVGQTAWDALTPNAKAAVTSLAYNYGGLQGLPSVVRAAQTGDPQAISRAIAARAVDNGGVNANRRQAEAAIAAAVPMGAATAGAKSAGGAQQTSTPTGSGTVHSIEINPDGTAKNPADEAVNPQFSAHSLTNAPTLYSDTGPANYGTRGLWANRLTSELGSDVTNFTDASVKQVIPHEDWLAARDASQVGGFGSVSDPNRDALLAPQTNQNPFLASAFARLGAAIASQGNSPTTAAIVNKVATLKVDSNGNPILPNAAPVPVRTPNSAAVIPASAPLPMSKEAIHQQLLAQQTDPKYTGKTVVGGIVGSMANSAVKQALPQVEATIGNAATTVKNTAGNLGNQLTGLAGNAFTGLTNFLTPKASASPNVSRETSAPKTGTLYDSQGNGAPSSAFTGGWGSQAIAPNKPAALQATYGPTSAQRAYINAVPASSYITPKPSAAAGGMAALAAGVGMAAGPSIKPMAVQQIVRPVVRPTVTLAQINQQRAVAPAPTPPPPVAAPLVPAGTSYLNASGINTSGMSAGQVGNALAAALGSSSRQSGSGPGSQ